MSVRSSLSDPLFLPDLFAVLYRLHRRSSATHLSLMRAFMIVVHEPRVKVGLQIVPRGVAFLAEGDLIKPREHREYIKCANTHYSAC